MITTSEKEGIVRRLPKGGLRLIEYRGDAMVGAHIVPHSKLLVDSCRDPQNGDVVVVQRGRKFTVRFYKSNGHKAWLVSASRQYADMLFDHADDMTIYVVVKVITDTRLLREYMF